MEWKIELVKIKYVKASIDQVVLLIAITLSALVQNNATRMLSKHFGIKHDGPYLHSIDELICSSLLFLLCSLHPGIDKGSNKATHVCSSASDSRT